ncbi:hypothetical protein BGZ57DRAFT_1005295 [Hyaloscypha finlandica]|nr:hypothetical protein BGZ57DRAFT_1005295 [Hyaloscypha finlandica]
MLPLCGGTWSEQEESPYTILPQTELQIQLKLHGRQPAYWTLIPLAINTISQPSGRISGVPGKYRTYIRCNPLICAVDTLSIFIHLAFYVTAFPFQDAIRLAIYERFGDNGSDEEGIQAIEKLTWVRWLFVIFGTAGPGIKLKAIEGVLDCGGAPWFPPP